jgi:hypothetical protein
MITIKRTSKARPIEAISAECLPAAISRARISAVRPAFFTIAAYRMHRCEKNILFFRIL